FFIHLLRPQIYTLFPYTTLFRSDLKSDYSLGLSEFFDKKFKELGGEIVSEQTFQTGDSDFKGQLTRIRSASPEAIFIPAYYTEVDRKSTRLNSSHLGISYAVFCL